MSDRFCPHDGIPDAYSGRSLIWLGTSSFSGSVDLETNGQPNTGATGDNSAGANDEEDIALVNPTQWFEGTNGGSLQVSLDSTNTGSNSGYLVVWFDWNGDGQFQPSEAAIN